MVELYTLPSCVQCDATKRMMNKYEIAFKEIKLQEAPEALEKIKGMGYASAPVVMAGESHWSGFRPDKIQSLAA